MKFLRNFLRKTIFFLIVFLGLGALFLWLRAEAILRHIAQYQFEILFPELVVEFDAIHLSVSEGVTIRGLRFYDQGPFHSDLDPVSHGDLRWEAEEVFVKIPVGKSALLRGEFFPTRVAVRHPTYYLNEKETCEDWNRLLPSEVSASSSSTFCPVEVTSAAIAIVGRETTRKGVNDRPYPQYTVGGLDCAILPPGFEEESLVQTWGRFDFEHTTSRLGWNEDPRLLWRIEALGKDNKLKNFALHAAVNHQGQWLLQSEIDTLEVDSDCFSGFFKDPSQLGPLQTLQGRTSMSVRIQSDPDSALGFRYNLKGTFFRGNIDLAILDHPISDLFMEYSASNDTIQVHRVTGRSGVVLLLADYTQTGHGAQKDAHFRAQLEELPLSRATLEKLRRTRELGRLDFLDQPFLKGVDFKTTAKLYLDYQGEGDQWKPVEVRLTCKDLSIEGGALPGRIEHVDGALTLDNAEVFSFNLQSRPEDSAHPVTASGKFTSALTSPLGEASIQIRGLSIDPSLLQTLPDSCRDEIMRLHPAGQIAAALRFRREKTPNTEIPEQNLRFAIAVQNLSICYDRFPYPVSGISGRIDYADGDWILSNFHGSAGNAEVECRGAIRDTDDGSSLFEMSLGIQKISLGEELLNAVTDPQQKDLIRRLKPNGRANATVQITYNIETEDFSLNFDAEPVPQSVSIQPEFFPYELKDLEGILSYRDGKISVQKLRGRNGRMTFFANVTSQFNPDGSWQIAILPMTVDQLEIDHQIESAMPSSLVKLISMLKLEGFFNMGISALFRQKSPNHPIEVLWDAEVIFEQNKAVFVHPIDNLCGSVRFWGMAAEGYAPYFVGEMNFDHLMVKDYQVTRMRGPLLFTGKELFFGNTVLPIEQTPLYQEEFLRTRLPLLSSDETIPSFNQFAANVPRFVPEGTLPPGGRLPGFSNPDPTLAQKNSNTILRGQVGTSLGGRIPEPIKVPEEPIPTPNPSDYADQFLGAKNSLISGRPVKAGIFKGTASLNGQILLNDPVTYHIGVLLQDGDLNETSRDIAGQVNPVHGRVSAYVDLQGEGRNIGTMKGTGGLLITEADLYEVPQIVKIFQSLSVQEPDQAAFNSCYVDFNVFGNQLALRRVTLEGNSLTLFGDGTVTVAGEQILLDLTMNSRLGNSKNRIPIISDVIGGAGDQIAQVRVEGPLNEPSIWQESFPGIRKAWWSIFPESEPAKGEQKRRRLLDRLSN